MICEEIVLTDCVNRPYFAYILENLSTVCLITHKINFQNFKPLFPVILQIFDLECHDQAPLKIAFLKFGDVFMKSSRSSVFYKKVVLKDTHREKAP